MPRVAATFPAERPFTSSSGPRRNALQLARRSLRRLFRERLFHDDSYQFTSRSSRPWPSSNYSLSSRSLVYLKDYDLGGGNALADLFIGEKLAISRITASTGHHVLGIRSRRGVYLGQRYARIIEKWRKRRDALISQASGVPYDLPTPF